ncbi:MAG: hypothetical protein AAFY73_06500 [Pseudomonadota bacterium]
MPERSRQPLLEAVCLVLQFGLAALCVMASIGKLIGFSSNAYMQTLVGLSMEQFVAVGLVQFGAALALIIPQTSRYGAVLVAALMFGANKVFLYGTGDFTPSAAIFIFCAALALAALRWESTMSLRAS